MRNEDLHDEEPRDAQEEQWAAEAPLLASLERKPAGDVPEGYFEDLPGKMMARIRALDAADGPPMPAAPTAPPSDDPAPARSLWQRPWRTVAIAASLLLLATVSIVLLSRPGTETVTPYPDDGIATLVSVSSEDILDELELSDLSQEELYEMLGQEAQAALDEEVDDLSQENLLDYLEGVDIDADDLEDLDLDPDFFIDATL